MAARGGGSIINISTMAATIGMNGLAAYGASKAAIESLTKAWTAEYGPRRTRQRRRARADKDASQRRDGRDVRRPGSDHARRAAERSPGDRRGGSFLASDDASFVYGTILPADGGRVAV